MTDQPSTDPRLDRVKSAAWAVASAWTMDNPRPATGGNDPRVPASEADQIVEAVRANGGQAWHLLAQNEGHGFHNKENEDYYFWTSLLFWKQTLLGDAAR